MPTAALLASYRFLAVLISSVVSCFFAVVQWPAAPCEPYTLPTGPSATNLPWRVPPTPFSTSSSSFHRRLSPRPPSIALETSLRGPVSTPPPSQSSYNSSAMSSSTPDDNPLPLTKEQRHRILSSPIHRHIKHETYGMLALGLLGSLSNIVGLILAAVWAKHILQTDKWFIFHYVMASILSLLWGVYSFVLMRDIKYLGWPDQLEIDVGWIMFSDLALVGFLLYIYRKMRTYGTLDMFTVACWTGCTTKLQFVKISPLVFACTSLGFGLIQLILSIKLYKNRIINPPLDAHGMPIPQDPETGEPLPLGPDGKPILPDWLKPVPSATQETSKTAKKTKKGTGGPKYAAVGMDGSDEEKTPLAAAGAPLGQSGEPMQELGRKKSTRSKWSEREGRR